MHTRVPRQSFAVAHVPPAAFWATHFFVVASQLAKSTHPPPEGQAPPIAILRMQVLVVVSQVSALASQRLSGHACIRI